MVSSLANFSAYSLRTWRAGRVGSPGIPQSIWSSPRPSMARKAMRPSIRSSSCSATSRSISLLGTSFARADSRSRTAASGRVATAASTRTARVRREVTVAIIWPATAAPAAMMVTALEPPSSSALRSGSRRAPRPPATAAESDAATLSWGSARRLGGSPRPRPASSSPSTSGCSLSPSAWSASPANRSSRSRVLGSPLMGRGPRRLFRARV